MHDLEPLSNDDIENIASTAVEDCMSFVESEISFDRIKAQRYYDGQVDIGQEEGLSSVVATKVRDTIRSIMPNLMRVFLQSDKIVEYVPRNSQEARFAEQASKYVNYKFDENHGYKVLYDVFQDALLKKCGIAKVYWDSSTEVNTYNFSNLNEMEFTALVNDDDIEIVKHVTEIEVTVDQNGMEIENPVHDLTLMRTTDTGKLVVESVPPEDFYVDANATSLEDAYCVAHVTDLRVSDLVEMGYDYDEVVDLGDASDVNLMATEESFERNGYTDIFDDGENLDPSMRKVMVTECYMKMDIEGTGVAQQYKLTLAGDNYKLLGYEPWTDLPFAVFETDPVPHTFYGKSISDLICEDQDAATALLRGVLNNVALVNTPRTEVLDGQVNIDDVLNNEIGGIVRVSQPNAIQPLAVPFVAGQTLSAIQYYDQAIEEKTGINSTSTGMNPDALQAQTATAVMAAMQGSANHIEIMARNLAEGGVAQMFKLMLALYIENCDSEDMMRLAGGDYEPVDPRSWDKRMGVSVKVGLGTGMHDQRQAALQQALQVQMQIFQSFGPENGLVGMTEVRHSLADILAMNGIKNAERYFKPMNPEIEQQIMMAEQQRAQSEGKQLTQPEAFVQAEQIKSESKAQTDMAKMQIDAQKAIAADDRERDQMDQDLLVDAAELLARYGAQVDVAQIKADQAKPRYPDSMPVDAVTGGRF
jgi:hypothetical protein